MIDPALCALVTELEASISDMPRAADVPGQLSAELAECKSRELALYKKASKGDAAAGAELLVLNAKLRVLPQEIEEAKAAISQSLGPLLDLAMQLHEQLNAAANRIIEGLTARVARVIEQTVAPLLPSDANPRYVSLASHFAVYLPGYFSRRRRGPQSQRDPRRLSACTGLGSRVAERTHHLHSS